MSPRAQRVPPPYAQIADHYRRAIIDGALAEGAKLPAIVKIADEWGVATTTAARGVTQLQVEGFVYSNPQGTFVQARHRAAGSPHDRLSRVRRGDALTAAAETEHVNTAEMVVAPVYVAELLDLEPGSRVIRREWISILERQLHMLSVSWFRPELAGDVPELLEARPIHEGGPVARIEQVTGRRVTEARDYYEAREADAREANAIGARVGSPILAGTYIWGDESGVIEYGEFVLPAKRVISYSYDVDSNE
jgi:GntR family transcriptional regulator